MGVVNLYQTKQRKTLNNSLYEPSITAQDVDLRNGIMLGCYPSDADVSWTMTC